MRLFALSISTNLAMMLVGLIGSAQAQEQSPGLNSYVILAVEELHKKYSGGGYDINSAYTHDVKYGSSYVRKTSALAEPAPSMCVAGVTEVILTAIQLYANKTGDTSPFTKAPLYLWTKGNLLSLKANFFMYSGTGSNGTASTLSRFGMGSEVSFANLRPGDFVNLNRTTKSGHAVVFLGYLKNPDKLILNYGPDVIGFKYFSIQGKGKPDAGFGYRYAYFSGACPAVGGNKVRDCNVIRSANPVLLNTGRLDMPNNWRVQESIQEMRRSATRSIEIQNPGITRAAIEDELNRELPMTIDSRYDGVDGM